MERIFRNCMPNRPIEVADRPMSSQPFNSFSAVPAKREEIKYELFYQGRDALEYLKGARGTEEEALPMLFS